jgi:uncharacterized protein YfaS (alpha-2-macroglobulin family)
LEWSDEEESYDFEEIGEDSYWDSWEEFYNVQDNDYYYDYYDYDWYDRDDPCTKAYYGDHMKVARNILASDMGLIAKAGTDGSMTVAISNLIDTKPIKGATVEVLDFQQQVLATGETDNNGMVNF